MPREQCENYEICDKYDCIYGICEGSDESDISLASSNIHQCNPSEKVIINILASIDDKLSMLLEK